MPRQSKESTSALAYGVQTRGTPHLDLTSGQHYLERHIDVLLPQLLRWPDGCSLAFTSQRAPDSDISLDMSICAFEPSWWIMQPMCMFPFLLRFHSAQKLEPRSIPVTLSPVYYWPQGKQWPTTRFWTLSAATWQCPPEKQLKGRPIFILDSLILLRSIHFSLTGVTMYTLFITLLFTWWCRRSSDSKCYQNVS